MSSTWKQPRHPAPAGRAATNPRPASRESRLRLAANRLSSGWVLLLYTLALLAATHWPAEFHTETRIAGVALDHYAHGLLYLPLTLILLGFLAHRQSGSFWRANRYWLTAAILLAGGALDELTQPWFRRTASVNDWIGDAVGVLVGVIAAWAVGRWCSTWNAAAD